MENSESLNKQIYERAKKEFDTFLEDLKNQKPDTIIENAYEIVIKKDTLCILEMDLSKNQITVLKDVTNPLETLYHEWFESENSHMKELRDIIENYSNRILDTQAIALYEKPDTPLYNKELSEARNLGEFQLWKADRQRNEDCLMIFNYNAILDYNDKKLPEFLDKWTKEFGLKRCKTILASVIQKAPLMM